MNEARGDGHEALNLLGQHVPSPRRGGERAQPAASCRSFDASYLL